MMREREREMGAIYIYIYICGPRRRIPQSEGHPTTPRCGVRGRRIDNIQISLFMDGTCPGLRVLRVARVFEVVRIVEDVSLEVRRDQDRGQTERLAATRRVIRASRKRTSKPILVDLDMHIETYTWIHTCIDIHTQRHMKGQAGLSGLSGLPLEIARSSC